MRLIAVVVAVSSVFIGLSLRAEQVLDRTEKARAFAKELLSLSESNRIQDALRPYAKEVLWMGHKRAKREIAEEFEAYIRRWPARRFNVSDDQITVTCDNAIGRCAVLMYVRWVAESPERNQRSSGLTKRSLLLEDIGRDFLISAFDEQILERNLTTLGQSLLQEEARQTDTLAAAPPTDRKTQKESAEASKNLDRCIRVVVTSEDYGPQSNLAEIIKRCPAAYYAWMMACQLDIINSRGSTFETSQYICSSAALVATNEIVHHRR